MNAPQDFVAPGIRLPGYERWSVPYQAFVGRMVKIARFIGVECDRLTLMQLYRVANAVNEDDLVQHRLTELPGCVSFEGTLFVVQAMSDAERAELRERLRSDDRVSKFLGGR
jgi:hypothetical protein